MVLIQRIAKNTMVIILGHILSALIGLVVVAFLARYLGTARFGLYNFVFFFLSFFGVITNLGIDTILVREISRDKSRAANLIGNSIVMKLILSVLAIVLASTVVILMGYPFHTVKLVLIASLSLTLAFGSLYEVIFQVNLKMEYPVVARFLGRLFSLVLILLVIFFKGTLVHLTIVTILSNLPVIFLMRYWSGGLVKPKLKIDFTVWKHLLGESWPVALIIFFSLIYVRIDIVMLSLMKDDKAVGLYSAAVKLVESLGIIPAAFMLSIFPLMSKYFKTSPDSLRRSYRLSFKYLMVIIIPIAFGTTLLSNQIILRLYGKTFIGATPALAVLVWSQVFIFGAVVIGNTLVSVDKQRIELFLAAIAAVANVILNFLLIPQYSFVGAAIATLISYAIAPAIALIMKSTRLYAIEMVKAMVKPIFSSALMGITLYYLAVYYLPSLVLAIAVGAVTYLITMTIIRGIDFEDVRFSQKILFGEGR